MSHDVLAELAGYRDELDNARRKGRDERAAAVQEQIDRVKAQAEALARAAESRAESFKADGQDVLAAQHEVEARRYRDALTEPGGEPETAVEAAPDETAAAKKTTRGGK